MSKGFTEVTTHDLRALLFWAAVGVRQSTGGSYLDIDHILSTYADAIGFKFDKPPTWGVDRKRAAEGKKEAP